MTALKSDSALKLTAPDIWGGKLFVGSWTTGSGGTIDVTDKATGEAIGSVADGTSSDVEKACEIAQEATRRWSEMPAQERAAIVRRAGELLEEYREEAVYWMIRETGSTRFKAEFEIFKTIEYFNHAADTVPSSWRTMLTETAEYVSYAERVPLGVVAVIGPFNFPMVLALRAVAPAIACGNAVVLKPSSNTVVSGGILLARLFEEAGLPPGVLNVVPGEGGTGAALVRNKHVSMIAFTGSTGVGRDIGASAGRDLKRVALELGGKNPFLVLEDADIELAARAGAFGTFLHQGQICISIGLHVVHEKVADAYVARLAELARDMKVGDPYREQVALGPVISEKQRDKIHAFVEDAIASGAELVEGGTFDGLFYRPTVVANISESAKLYREEAFGPIAAIVTFRDDEEALKIVNGSDYGLTAGVFGEIEHARKVAARVQSGMVHINNQPVMAEARAPFGGVKSSGNTTRIGAGHDVDEYTTSRWVTEALQPQPYALPNQ